MSSAGRAASSSGCVARPRGRETGLTGYAASIQHSSPIGSSVMETAKHREPYESRGSRTDLGAPGGESPPGDSTFSPIGRVVSHRPQSADSRPSRPATEREGSTHSRRPKKRPGIQTKARKTRFALPDVNRRAIVARRRPQSRCYANLD